MFVCLRLEGLTRSKPLYSLAASEVDKRQLFDRTVHDGTFFAEGSARGWSTEGGAMGSSAHPLQPHMSGWPSCAIWDPYVAGDRKPNSQIPGPTLVVPFWGGTTYKIVLTSGFFTRYRSFIHI